MKPLVIRLSNGIVLWVENGHAWHVDTIFQSSGDPDIKAMWFSLEIAPEFVGGHVAKPEDVAALVERFGRPQVTP